MQFIAASLCAPTSSGAGVLLHLSSTQHQCGPLLGQAGYLVPSTGQAPRKMGNAVCGPQCPLPPKADEGVIVHLMPLLLVVCTSWKPGGAERMLKRIQPCRRCSLIPELNLTLRGPTKPFPAEHTSDGMFFHGPWWRLERPCPGGSGGAEGDRGQVLLCPLSALHCNSDALG